MKHTKKLFLTMVVLALIIFPYRHVYAFDWRDLWSRPDQQAAQLLAEGEVDAAAKRFNDKQWRGVAHYRGGDFQQAMEDFAEDHSGLGLYNLGNALANAVRFEDAIVAYDEALKRDPENEDAQFNRDLVKDLLEEQSQSSSDSDGEKQEEEQEDDQDQNESEQQQEDDEGDEDDDQTDDQEDDQDGEQEQESEGEGESEDESEPEGSEPESPQEEGSEDDQEQQPETPPDQAPEIEQQEEAATTQEQEQQQSQEQWLKRVPDDPGGLLKQKFLRDHLRNRARKQ
ncbi:MAG: tetratricopeptide repeat protein [Gammaproteobacteria bacterium]